MTQTFPEYRALFTRMVDDLRHDPVFVVDWPQKLDSFE